MKSKFNVSHISTRAGMAVISNNNNLLDAMQTAKDYAIKNNVICGVYAISGEDYQQIIAYMPSGGEGFVGDFHRFIEGINTNPMKLNKALRKIVK